MTILVDQKALSTCKERFGDIVDEIIDLGKKLFSQYEDELASEVMVMFSGNLVNDASSPTAKLAVSYRYPSRSAGGAMIVPAIIFKVTE